MKVHRSLACMLIATLPFICCFSDNAKLETAEKIPTIIEISPKLEEQAFTSREGHLVNFKQTKKGKLKASVKLDYLRDPYVGLPVYIDRTLDQQKVNVNQLKEWEKSGFIHVRLAKGQQIPYIYITHNKGLKREGRKNSKKNNTKEKEKDTKEQLSKKLHFPNPTALSIGKRLSDQEAQSLLEKAQKCKENPTYLQVAINSFLELAKRGYGPIQHEAICQLGLICKEQGQFELAVRWHVAAFEHSWWKDPQQAHQSLACQALKSLGYERIPLIYPNDITKEDIKKPELQYEIYTSLIEFYQNGTAEPYLSQAETRQKIDVFTQARRLMVNREENKQPCILFQGQTHNITRLINEGKDKETERCMRDILEKFPSRICLHNLGLLYERQGNDQNAAEYYRKGAMAGSFLNLGNLYFEGRIGKINGEIDYQTAINFYEIAGCSGGLYNIALIYKNGHIGQPDYQKAEEYLKRADTNDAHYALGVLYFKGSIGKNAPHPDYTLAAYHFGKAIEKGCIGGWNDLGLLYYLGYEGKDNNQPNYALAVECFKKATEIPIEEPRYQPKEAWRNLGVIYANGYYGTKDESPDYETAKEYFEKSGKPEALYNIGLLYEKGCIGTIGSEINYLKALTYYEKSALPEAQLAILHLYQSEQITTNPAEKQQAINKTIEEINHLLPDLPTNEQLYIQGMIQYYMGNWEDALVTLREVWMQGSQELKPLAALPKVIEIIEVIEEGLEAYYFSKFKEEINIQEPLIKTEIINYVEKEKPLEIRRKEEKIELQEPTQEMKIIEPKPIEVGIETQKSTIETEKNFTEKHIEFQQITTWKTLTKAQKKIIQSQRNRDKFLDNLIQSSPAFQQPKVSLELEFKDNNAEEAFEAFKKDNKKLNEILENLTNNPWSTQGVGRPKVLKGNLSEYMSRRITKADRLVYMVTGANKIRILSWAGHYKSVKKF